MNDPALVRGFERVGDLPGDRQHLVQRHRTPTDAIGKRRSIDELQHQRADAVAVLQAVNRGDVGMVECGEDFRFALEARNPFRIAGKGRGQDLYRDIAFQQRVARSINLAHATGAEHGFDFVGTEARSALERHCCGFYTLRLKPDTTSADVVSAFRRTYSDSGGGFSTS